MDGFGAHFASLNALATRKKNNILTVKEEGDSSHVNQAYDKFVAKSDKAAKASSLGTMRHHVYKGPNKMDQWTLVHCGLAAINATTEETWVRSFAACNLQPSTRVNFNNSPCRW